MGIYRSALTVLVLFLFLPCPAEAARRTMCLACHETHHAERGSCVNCHRGNDRTDRKEIAHHGFIAGRFAHYTIKGSPVAARGEKLVEVLACRRCHVYERKGNRPATDLGGLARDIAPQTIFDSIRSPVPFMPNFHLDGMQIAAIVNAILAGLESAGVRVQETAQVVHFVDEKQGRENIFVTQCGPCHKLIGERFGGLGNGDIGPNLSGLLSEYYPNTYRDTEPWTPGNLRKWLENPRNVRANARMKPVRLAVGDFVLLMKTIRINLEVYTEKEVMNVP